MTLIDPLRLKKLLLRMIDIYSPSGKEEALLSYLKGYLKRRGFDVQVQPVAGVAADRIAYQPQSNRIDQ